MPGRRHRFGPFEFDPEQRVLFRNGAPVPLQPKLADLLHALLESRGRVVDRQELMRRVWPDAIVEDTGLARNISLLRKALGDEGEESRYIETIPKRGYRFLAEEQPADPTLVRRSARRLILAGTALVALALFVWWQFYRPSRFVPSSSGPWLAIVPFACSGGPLCETAFAQSFEELLAAELSAPGRIRLVSPSTVHRYIDNRIPVAFMARLLGLDLVLEGSVSIRNDQIRIIARLSDTHSGQMVWSAARDLPASDPSGGQREAARQVAAAVNFFLSEQKP
ncbi:MAG: winged helix-turn-helix domain-containing protein [Bryobacteraceae bacterium]|nr:winged helix-turn-helix domain-containing protein [Bryobacteraceae bacterium]